MNYQKKPHLILYKVGLIIKKKEFIGGLRNFKCSKWFAVKVLLIVTELKQYLIIVYGYLT